MVLPNFLRLNILSFGFFLVFVAYSSAAILAPQIMVNLGYEGLGFYSVAVLYLVFGTCSLFSAGIVNSWGTKKSLFFGSLCYSLWIFSFLPPAFAIYSENKDSNILYSRGFVYFSSFFTAAFIGFGASIIWVAQGKYVSICCPPEKKGFFFSYFWVIATSCNIVGNLVSSVILEHLRESTLYIILVCIGVSGSMTFLFLTDPPQQFGQQQTQQDQQQNTTKPVSFKDNFKDTVNLVKHPRMLMVIPIMIQQAISMVATSANFLPMLYITLEQIPDMNESIKFKTCLLAFIPFGVGEMVGGAIFGQVLDRFKHKFTLFMTITLTLTSYAILFTQIYLWEFSSFIYILTFVWGVQDAFIANFVQCVCGFEFDSNVLPFSVQRLIEAIMTFILLMISSTLKTQYQFTLYFVFTMIFGIFSLLLMLKFKYRGKQRLIDPLQESAEKLNEMSELIKDYKS